MTIIWWDMRWCHEWLSANMTKRNTLSPLTLRLFFPSFHQKHYLKLTLCNIRRSSVVLISIRYLHRVKKKLLRWWWWWFSLLAGDTYTSEGGGEEFSFRRTTQENSARRHNIRWMITRWYQNHLLMIIVTIMIHLSLPSFCLSSPDLLSYIFQTSQHITVALPRHIRNPLPQKNK